MNKKYVYKYPAPRVSKKFELMLPQGYKFLRTHFQGDNLFIWCEVNRDALQEMNHFEVFGTGQEIPSTFIYLTTFDDGPFVFHLYRVA